ncbi:fructose bisphosphate aldolase [Methylobacterium sp. 092160098-2]|uniref:fructose bisphosphate aldolase n=1 Tax=Methylobacterium sp. 092160098-2 TaxID=3025129 RepID=UPI002381B267|nr:fructose bisphosphate aldolase [Methylobacterium sp. 092160098-2]MDE4915130.1 fructose bisphosphate aldolase [Methylobacterium sp. 092160098-2]
MLKTEMTARIKADGFIAALDQSGGSTPNALRHYGIPEDSFEDEAQMFSLMHAMRVRIISSPAFTGASIIGAILFEGTMNGLVNNRPVPSYLWEERAVVPFLKVDKGLEAETHGVNLMKPIPNLDSVLERATKLGVYGTKMRSLINFPDQKGIATLVNQQFATAATIAAHGLMPIVEPEISIESPYKQAAEEILLAELTATLDAMTEDSQVILKLTLPDVQNFYAPLIDHPRVVRVVALSGGFSRAEACRRLAKQRGIIASFSRALTEELRVFMEEDDFCSTLSKSVEQIYSASVHKT